MVARSVSTMRTRARELVAELQQIEAASSK